MKIFANAICVLGTETPDYRRYLAGGEIRRLGEGLRNAIFVSCESVERTGICSPDAIVVATDSGCLDNTLKFLDDIQAYNEGALKPSLFMYSTHNAFASVIALHFKCHGHNSTHSNGNKSLENALEECRLLISGGHCDNILLCMAEETSALTPGRKARFAACIISSSKLSIDSICIDDYDSLYKLFLY